MQQALPIFILLGIVVVSLTLILVGIFVNARSRHARQEAEMPPYDQVSAGPLGAPLEKSSGSVHFHIDADGATSVEVDGRRFAHLDHIGDERLIQRVLAAAAKVQHFTGVTPSDQRLTPAELTDELRAGHAPAGGTLVVEFRGERYRQLTDVRDGETGRQLLSMIGELVAFAQGRFLRPAAPDASGESGGPPEDAFLKKLAVPPSVSTPLRMPTLVESLQRTGSRSEPASIGIAGQIEKVLQEQLVDNVALQGRTIHVTTASDGSLVVDVEGAQLHWPDQVRDPAVREAVQKAIRTWERS
jgi:hypothetical protein